MKCKICNKECGRYLKGHLQKEHELTDKEYYDIYLREDEQEGFCLTCGNLTRFRNAYNGYAKYCSNKCLANSAEVKAKKENTNLERYGSKNYFTSKEGQEKLKGAMLEKYGVESYLASDESKKKMKEANLAKYGTEYVMQSDKGKKQFTNTNLERYGVENPLQREDIREKIKQTNLKKYGVEHPIQSEEIREKTEKTNLEKYGHKNMFASEYGKNKIKETNLEKYGVEYIGSSKEIQDKIRATNLERYGVESVLSDPDVREKIKETMLEKYGYDHNFKVPEIQEQIKRTNLERYGYENIFLSPVYQERIRQTMLDKYGYDNNFKIPEIQEKIKQTNIEKYGVPYPIQSEDIQEKIRRNNLEKYGVEHTFQVKEFRDRAIQTNLEKYGCLNPMQNQTIQDKAKSTNLEKYGVENVFQSKEIINKIKATNLEKYGVEYSSQSHISNIDDWLNLREFLIDNDSKYDCLLLSKYFNISLNMVRRRVILEGLQDYIKDFYTLSHPEMQFKQLLDNRLPNISCIMHDRKAIAPLELDFYLPDNNLAIEISPTYTHRYIGESTDEKFIIGVADKEYHYNKFKSCEDNGIELITIFDWEDLGKVISLVKNKLEPSLIKIYARKTNTIYVDKVNKDHKDFLDSYHVLGKINNKRDSFVLELRYKDELVGLAVYYKTKNSNQVELKRLAFKGGYTIVGGASKLIRNVFKYKADIDSIITFSDNNLGTGAVYSKVGFELTEDNKYSCTYYNPQYDWAVKETSLWLQGADRLLANFPNYKPVGIGDDLPKNDEIVMSYGFIPVYDCGYRKWIYKKEV